MSIRRARSLTRTIIADVEIDLDAELSNDDLIALARERGIAIASSAPRDAHDPGALSPREWWERLADDIRDAAQRDDRTHLNILLHRMPSSVGAAPLPIVRAAGEPAARH